MLLWKTVRCGGRAAIHLYYNMSPLCACVAHNSRTYHDRGPVVRLLDHVSIVCFVANEVLEGDLRLTSSMQPA